MKKSQVEIESRVIHGAHGVSAEEDHILTGKVVQVGVGALVIFIVGGIWAWRLQIATTHEFAPEGPAPIPALITPDEDFNTTYEIGIVNQRMFVQDTHAEEKIASQQKSLDEGSGDQPGVRAHLPITQAMDAIISEQASVRGKPTPAPTPEQTPSPRQ